MYNESLWISRSRECCWLSMAIYQFSMTIINLLSKIPPLSQLVARSSVLGSATLATTDDPSFQICYFSYNRLSLLQRSATLATTDYPSFQICYFSYNRLSLDLLLEFQQTISLQRSVTTDSGPTFIPPCTLVILYSLNQASSEIPAISTYLLFLPASNQSHH